MRRFKSLAIRIATCLRTSTIPITQATQISNNLVPVRCSTFSAEHNAERPEQPTPVPWRMTPRIEPMRRPSTASRIHKALSGFVLWFGLLFSAVLLGTFIVLGIVMVYALVMSIIGG